MFFLVMSLLDSVNPEITLNNLVDFTNINNRL